MSQDDDHKNYWKTFLSLSEERKRTKGVKKGCMLIAVVMVFIRFFVSLFAQSCINAKLRFTDCALLYISHCQGDLNGIHAYFCLPFKLLVYRFFMLKNFQFQFKYVRRPAPKNIICNLFVEWNGKFLIEDDLRTKIGIS